MTTTNELVKQESSLLRTENGFTYRDLNKNGKLDVYEDPRQPVEARVEDLLGQLTLEEKAGMMFINGSVVNEDGSLEDRPAEGWAGRAAINQMSKQKMTHFNLWAIPNPQAMAIWNNNLQRFAEQTRLGIPITIASDPRNHFTHNIFAMPAAGFSQWCETTGFGAIGDPELVRQFADQARQEYLAVGIRVALHPQVDLATEPRWPRISGTFGEDAQLTAKLTKAYIEGFQGEQLGPHSVACMTKHFPGGGPQNEGLDPHFEFQKGQIYPGNNFDYHLIPFEAAFEAGTAAIMPYYGVPVDQTDENVAMALQQDDHHRAVAPEIRLRRRGVHRLGADHRHPLARVRLAGKGLGRGAPQRDRAGEEGARGGRGPVRRGEPPRAGGRAGEERAADRSTPRCVGAPPAARASSSLACSTTRSWTSLR